MPETTTLLAKLAADWPPEQWRDVTVVVAVSGGADSMALARALPQLKSGGEGRLVLAHFNHGLRGAESDGDQAFVEALARELALPVIAGRRDGATERRRDGEASEESLRELRYEFLARMADEAGARFVATAHTADDQVETVLHNILRGTGLAGLAGIPRARPLTESATLIRPLLGVTRAEVLKYLETLGQPHREDSSNQATHYTRNRIRHELLPLLASDYNPHVRDALTRLGQIASAADQRLQDQAADVLSRAARKIDGGIEIEMRHFEGGDDLALQYALLVLWRQQSWLLQAMSFEKWQQLLAFTRAPAPAPQTFPGNIRAEKHGDVLRLSRAAK